MLLIPTEDLLYRIFMASGRSTIIMLKLPDTEMVRLCSAPLEHGRT